MPDQLIDREVTALQTIVDAMKELDAETQARIVRWMYARYMDDV